MRSAKRIHCLGPSRMGLLRGCVLAAVLLVGALPGCSDSTDLLIPIDPPEELRGGDFYPAWSPDGQTVAFFSDDIDSLTQEPELSLRAVDVATGAVSTISPMRGLVPHSLAWSPDGRWLVFSTTLGIFKILATGDSLTRLTAGQYHVSPSWSRVSDRIFFGINGGGEAGIHSMSPDGTDLRQWTYSDSIRLVFPFLFPDSDTMTAFAPAGDSGLCLVLYVPGDPKISSILHCGFRWLSFIKISPGHGYVAFNTVQTKTGGIVILSLLDRSDGSVSVLVGTLTEGFDFDPGGGRIVYSDLGRTRGLQVIDIRTGEVSQLTPGHP